MNIFRRIRTKLYTLWKSEPIVLMYHKIGSPASDPWKLSVSAANFETHLQVLQKSKNVISTQDLVNQINTGNLKKNTVAITFDDGCLDNYEIAKPLLEKYNMPATFFITDDAITTGEPFWWEELEQILLHSKVLPSKLSITLGELDINFDLGEESTLTPDLVDKHKNFIAYEPVSLRSRLYYELWQIFSPLPSTIQKQLMGKVREWAGLSDSINTTGCMSWAQLKDLSRSDLFTIAGHTCHHPSLYDHPEEVQKEEILLNKKRLINALEIDINLFAFPSGRYNDISINILKENGFKGAFTTIPRKPTVDTDVWQIGRYQALDEDKDTFKRTLKMWNKP